MIRNILLSSLLFLFVACSSGQLVQPEFKPHEKYGCSEYKSSERLKCIEKQLERLEEMDNSRRVVILVDKDRKDSVYSIFNYKISVVSLKTNKEIDKDEFSIETYDPTWHGRIIHNIQVFGIGGVTGAVLVLVFL